MSSIVQHLKLKDWESRSVDTVYEAASDGYVKAFGDTANTNCQVLTDSVDPPTVIRDHNRDYAWLDASGVGSLVKKGDYWTVIVSAGGATVFWIPLKA